MYEQKTPVSKRLLMRGLTRCTSRISRPKLEKYKILLVTPIKLKGSISQKVYTFSLPLFCVQKKITYFPQKKSNDDSENQTGDANRHANPGRKSVGRLENCDVVLLGLRIGFTSTLLVFRLTPIDRCSGPRPNFVKKWSRRNELWLIECGSRVILKFWKIFIEVWWRIVRQKLVNFDWSSKFGRRGGRRVLFDQLKIRSGCKSI